MWLNRNIIENHVVFMVRFLGFPWNAGRGNFQQFVFPVIAAEKHICRIFDVRIANNVVRG